MKDFNVWVNVTMVVKVRVSAENDEVAAEKAERMVSDNAREFASQGEYIECFAVNAEE